MHSVSVDVAEITCGHPLMTTNFACHRWAASLATLNRNSVIAWEDMVAVSANL